MSWKSKHLDCPAINQNITSFAERGRIDRQGRVACPVCGKTVQLMARGKQPAKVYIPRHYRESTPTTPPAAGLQTA